MQECHFKIQYDGFTAELLIGGDISLYAFAGFIIKSVGFEFDHAFQFCDNLKYPYRSEERYTLFADLGNGEPGDGSVKKTKLSQVFRPNRQLVGLPLRLRRRLVLSRHLHRREGVRRHASVQEDRLHRRQAARPIPGFRVNGVPCFASAPSGAATAIPLGFRGTKTSRLTGQDDVTHWTHLP